MYRNYGCEWEDCKRTIEPYTELLRVHWNCQAEASPLVVEPKQGPSKGVSRKGLDNVQSGGLCQQNTMFSLQRYSK